MYDIVLVSRSQTLNLALNSLNVTMLNRSFIQRFHKEVWVWLHETTYVCMYLLHIQPNWNLLLKQIIHNGKDVLLQ